MPAFLAAKRTALCAVCLAFLAAAPLAVAADGNDGYLGVMLQDITPSMAKALQLEENSGVMINDVVDDSPAEKAGLKDGDVILEFQGKAMGGNADLTKAVRSAGAGEKVELLVLRGGKKVKVQAELGEAKNTFNWVDAKDGKTFIFKGNGDDEDRLFPVTEERGFLGVHLDDIEGQMADYFEVKDGQGVLITEVNEDGPAAKAGLKAGDVVVKLDDQEVGSSSELHKAMAGTEPGQEIEVQVVRKGKDKSFKVTLGEMPEGMNLGDLQFFGDDGDISIRAPKMLFHGNGDRLPTGPHARMRMLRKDGPDIQVFTDDEGLTELRQELKQMQKELQELKKELKK